MSESADPTRSWTGVSPTITGLSQDECLLLSTPLPHGLSRPKTERLWAGYQSVIEQMLMRMGAEKAKLDVIARALLVDSVGGVKTRMALVPMLSRSALDVLERHSLNEFTRRIAGEFCLMELSAAAGYRTFCFPGLIRGLLKTGKMKDRPVERMMDTFEVLNTMVRQPMSSIRVEQQVARTNGLHAKYRVAGAAGKEAQDLFKYIALNMFYIGPSMRPDITPAERHAFCGLTVLVAEKMGHAIEGSVNDFDAFIAAYEASHMFSRDDTSVLRQRAIEIAAASRAAVDQIPTVSPECVHAYVPYTVKKILRID